MTASDLDWTIVRPSVIFGPEDAFLNLFAQLLRFAPVMALARADAKFQPVYVGDVAECIVRAVGLPETVGRTFPLCGPRIYTLRELVRYAGAVTGKSRPIIALGPMLGRLEATVLEHLPGTMMSRDNLASMQEDSICGCDFPPEFGIEPQALETIAPSYLGAEAAKSRYDRYRARGGR